jgi:hypothetical protein
MICLLEQSLLCNAEWKDGEWRTLEDAKKCVILFQVDFDIGQSEGHKTVKIFLMKN